MQTCACIYRVYMQYISARVSVCAWDLCMYVHYVRVHLRIYICFLCLPPAEGYTLTEVYSLCVCVCMLVRVLTDVCICRMGIQLLGHLI